MKSVAHVDRLIENNQTLLFPVESFDLFQLNVLVLWQVAASREKKL